MAKKKTDRPSDLNNLSEQIAGVLDAAGPGIVRVRAGRRPWAGVVWDGEHVVTVAHPLRRRGGALTVRTHDDRRLDGELVGWDRATDLALIKVDPGDSPLTPPTWSDGDDLKVGHLVLTAARPRGELRATMGLVSALSSPGEAWRTRGGGIIDRYIDVDAALPRGFSGGPLLDASGGVLGLNTPLLRRAGTTVPTATVRRVVGELQEHGETRRGWLGVGVATGRLPTPLAEAEGRDNALVLTAVEEDGPADKAGLLLGDVLLALDDQPLGAFDDLLVALATRADSTSAVRLLRGGEPTQLDVEVGRRPAHSRC